MCFSWGCISSDNTPLFDNPPLSYVRTTYCTSTYSTSAAGSGQLVNKYDKFSDWNAVLCDLGHSILGFISAGSCKLERIIPKAQALPTRHQIDQEILGMSLPSVKINVRKCIKSPRLKLLSHHSSLKTDILRWPLLRSQFVQGPKIRNTQLSPKHSARH